MWRLPQNSSRRQAPSARRATSWPLWLLAFVLSTGVPVGLFAYLRETADQEPLAGWLPKPKPIRVKMSPSKAPLLAAVPVAVPKPAPKPPEPPLPKDAQIVTVRPPEIEEAPEKTKYLAQVDSTVKKEKKSKPSARRAERKAGAPAPALSPVQSKDSKSLEKTTAKEARPEAAKAAPDTTSPPDENGVHAPDTEVSKDQGSRLLLPTFDRASALANVQTLTGSGATSDFLADVEEEGEETVLNTRRFQHWDFFNQVQERVRQNWRASDVYQRRDPSGRVFGVKDRLTILRVTLDATGKVAKLITIRDSGIDALDKEARRALSVASPFNNPPKALLDPEGRLTFQFSFMLELSSSRLRISRVPM